MLNDSRAESSLYLKGASLPERVRDLARVLRETPIVPLQMEDMNLFAKLEHLNGVGSIKDRPAYYILRAAIERGEVQEDTTVIESSSGNFAVALATFCRLLRLDFVPVIDPNVTRSKESLLRTMCDQVVMVDTADNAGGYLKSRLQKIDELRRTMRSAYWTNQYGNTDGMRAHFELTGGEICQRLSNLDYAFIGVGSGGTIAGVSRRLREECRGARIIAVDAQGSAIFGDTPRKRYIPGIGSSIIPDLLKQAVIDEVVTIPESETVAACLELFERHSLFVGGSSGSAYAAVKRYAKGFTGTARPNVLFLCCDGGVGYVDTIFNERWRKWHREQQENHKGSAQ